jgi:hypothetical protein
VKALSYCSFYFFPLRYLLFCLSLIPLLAFKMITRKEKTYWQKRKFPKEKEEKNKRSGFHLLENEIV